MENFVYIPHYDNGWEVAEIPSSKITIRENAAIYGDEIYCRDLLFSSMELAKNWIKELTQ